MQYSQNAKNFGNPQQPYSEQAAQFAEELTELLANIVSHPPDEIVQLANRLVGVQSKDKPHFTPNLAALHRMGDILNRMTSILYRKPNSTMGELSQALSVPLYTATRLVDSLVENGLADRLSDPDDRRIVRVTLTDDGRRFHKVMEAHIAQKIEGLMAHLTPEEQDILIALLHKATASLRESKT